MDKAPRRRIWRCAGAALGSAALLAGVAWWQSDTVLEWAAGRVLSAEVKLEGLRLGNPVRVDRLILRDTDDSSATDFFLGEGVTLHFGGGVRRWVSTLNFKRVRLAVEETPARNHDFVQALLAAPPSGVNPLPFLPESIEAELVSLSFNMPTGILELEGLRFNTALRGLSDADVTLDGASVSGAWTAAGVDAAPIPISGSIAATLRASAEGVDSTIAVDLPQLARLNATANAQTRPNLSASVTVSPGEISNPVWSEMLGGALGYPVRFDTARIDGGSLSVKDGQVESLSFDMDTPGVTFGPADSPHFRGPLKVSARGSNTMGVAGEVTLRSGEAAPVVLELATADGSLGLTLPETRWRRSDWERLLPGAYAGYLKSWPALRSASLAGELLFNDEGVTLQAELGPECERAREVELRLDARFPNGTPPVASLTATAKGAGGWNVVYGETPGTAAVSVESASLSAWIDGVLGYPLALDETARVSGSGQIGLGEAHVTLGGAWMVSQGDASIGKVRVEDASWSTADSSLQAPLRVSLDLAALAPLLGIADLAGTLEGSCKVVISGGEIRAQSVKASVNGLVAGGNALPGETPLSVTGDVGKAASGAAGGEAALAWGEDFKAALQEASWGPASDTWSAGGLEATATATALHGFGLLDSGDFTLSATAAGLSRTGEVYTGTGSATLRGDLVTTGGLLAAKALDATLSVDLSQEVALAGPLRAGELAALGVTLRDATATLRLSWPRVYVENLNATIFGGGVVANMEMDLAAENFPVTVTATLTNTDLTRFTEEFKPPNGVKLTGLVNGDIRAAVAGESITELSVDLVSGEGFTLDKATVAQMLMSQEIGEISGSGLADKIVKSVVGNEDARPFTGAELRLGLEGGRISGAALLKSKALNLTVDIHADQQALFEAIRMRQEGQIANFTTTLN